MNFSDNPMYRPAQAGDQNQIVECIAQGFHHLTKHLSKDQNQIKQFLLDSLLFDYFYVIELDSKVVGCCSVTPANLRPISISVKSMRAIFGFIKGSIATNVLKALLEKPYQFDAEDGYIEYVTILEDYRRLGLTTGLLTFILHQNRYRHLMLDVTSDHKKAFELYQKLDFKEFKRVKQRFSKQAGFDYLSFMKVSLESRG